MLVFDFDGILIDSVDEVLLTAYRCELRDQGNFLSLPRSLEALPKPYVNLYRTYRPYVQPAGDLLTLARWCIEHPQATSFSLEEWAHTLAQEKRTLDQRRESFFAERAILFKEDPQSWFALNKPYQPLWNAFCKAADSVFILTNKNRKAVLDLCAFYQCSISSSHIFSGDSGATKQSNFLDLHQQFIQGKAENTGITFVEDSVHNLIDLIPLQNSLKLEFCLGDWGYVTKADLTNAAHHGIAVQNQQQIVTRIEQHRKQEYQQ